MISKGGQISPRRFEPATTTGGTVPSLADCCLVAVATAADRVATADPAVLRMAEAEGIGTVALPRP